MSATLIILTPGFPADESDENCLPYFQTFVRAINRNYPHLKLTIISTQYPYQEQAYDWFGNQVIPLNAKQSSKWLKPFVWLKAMRLANKIRQNQTVAGVLCFWCLEEALIGRLINSMHPAPLRIWICGQDAKAENPWVKWIRPKHVELVANSHFIADVFEKNHAVRPSSVVANSIDPTTFPPLPTERPIDLIFVGSLIPLKQPQIVLRVIRQLADRGLQPHAIICGSGPEQPRLQKLAEDLAITKFVLFRGEVGHVETLALLQQAKILLHPSSFEGYSTVCLEALYAGCEVVSFIAAEPDPVDHWHIVNTEDEMVHTCLRLLEAPLNHQRILLHTADEAARTMMALLGII